MGNLEGIDVDRRSTRDGADTLGAVHWLLLVLAALWIGPLGCGPVGGAEAEPPAPEHHVASMIRAWFSSLEGQSPESVALERFLVESPLGFRLGVGGGLGANGLGTWVSDLRSPYPQVEYRIGAIRIDDSADGSYRARFEVDRRAVDSDGVPHVARSAHRWVVAGFQGAVPTVTRIDHEPLLSFPGTGPQVVCY
jgi:hypothetical protein